MKTVCLAVGVLLFAGGMIRSGLRIDNHGAALGLILFSLGAIPYFLPGNGEGGRRFHADWLWLSIYLTVILACSFWLWLLLT